jgi:Short C-terminal domain
MPGLLRGLARTAAIAGTATAVSNRVSRRQYNKWSQQAEEEAPPQPQQPVEQAPPPAAPSGQDRLAQLKELGELKAQGVLTEQEFAAEKAKILGQ